MHQLHWKGGHTWIGVSLHSLQASGSGTGEKTSKKTNHFKNVKTVACANTNGQMRLTSFRHCTSHTSDSVVQYHDGEMKQKHNNHGVLQLAAVFTIADKNMTHT